MTIPAAPAAASPPPAAKSAAGRLAPYLDALRTGLDAARSGGPDWMRGLWREHRDWLWVLVPVTALAWPSVRWATTSWSATGWALLFQPLTPFVAFALALTRRQQVIELYREMEFLFPGDSPKRRGRLWPVLIGCVMMLVAALTTASTFAFVGLLTIVVGAVYYIYGPFVTRALWQPLALLASTIPPPAGLMGTLSIALQAGGAVVAAQLAQPFAPGARAQYDQLTLSNYRLDVSPELGGLNVLLSTLALLVWYCLFRRVNATLGVLLVGAGALVVLLLNALRITALGLIGNANTAAADALIAPGPAGLGSAALTAASVAITLVGWRRVVTARRRNLSEFEADLREAYRLAQEQQAANAAASGAQADKGEGGAR